MKLINIGFGNMVVSERIIAVISPESSPIKRLISESRDRNMLIDATHGRRTRAVLFTDSDHIILTYLQPETVSARLAGKEDIADDDESQQYKIHTENEEDHNDE